MKNKIKDEYDFESIYPNKKCLSSSQFLCYEKDPQQFYLKYILGTDRGGSKAMEVGKIFSRLYANREYDFKTALQDCGAGNLADLFTVAIKKFPLPVEPEYPMICDFNKWKFRATLDDWIPKTNTIIENKTGQVAWTQERANYSDQITFQAWCHWKKFDIPPRRIILNWLDLRVRSRVSIKSFNTSRSVGALRNFDKRAEVVIENLLVENFTKQIYE